MSTKIERDGVDGLKFIGLIPVKYFVDGKQSTAEGYIDWLHAELERVKSSTLPPLKFYGGSAEEGDQHETKCAYVDGWNECRAAMPKTPKDQS